MTEGRKGALACLDVEGAPELAHTAREFFAAPAAHDGTFVTSELVLAEILAGPRIRRIYMDLIVWKLPTAMMSRLETGVEAAKFLIEAANGR